MHAGQSAADEALPEPSTFPARSSQPDWGASHDDAPAARRKVGHPAPDHAAATPQRPPAPTTPARPARTDVPAPQPPSKDDTGTFRHNSYP